MTDTTLDSYGGTTDLYYEYQITTFADTEIDYPDEEPDPPLAVNEQLIVLIVNLSHLKILAGWQPRCRGPPLPAISKFQLLYIFIRQM